MLSVFHRNNGAKLTCTKEICEISSIEKKNVIWIDLFNATPEEKKCIEEYLGVEIQSIQEAQEIESSSRYFESDEIIKTNSNFLIFHENHYHNEPVSFILKDNVLVSFRYMDFRSFTEMFRRIEINSRLYQNGFHVYIALFETRIDLDADLLESLAKDIASIAKQITLDKNSDEEIIIKITSFQEMTMLLRENIIDKQRVISAILKSEFFPKDYYEKIRIMIKDIGSLLDHTTFSFERLEYLQDTFLGLVNIEQNKIIKIFTVVTVVFMPPTLIASMYGMNFQFMPELGWKHGYLFAILLMILSSLITLFFFKRKRWL